MSCLRHRRGVAWRSLAEPEAEVGAGLVSTCLMSFEESVLEAVAASHSSSSSDACGGGLERELVQLSDSARLELQQLIQKAYEKGYDKGYDKGKREREQEVVPFVFGGGGKSVSPSPSPFYSVGSNSNVTHVTQKFKVKDGEAVSGSVTMNWSGGGGVVGGGVVGGGVVGGRKRTRLMLQ